MKIGFVTDLHFREAVPGTSKNERRECRYVVQALRRCLARLRELEIDLLVCAGDCVDDGTLPGALEDVATLRDIFATSGLRTIVIPGNHDPAPDDFYALMPRPPRALRLGGVEFLTFFDDACAPGAEVCFRSPESLRLMADTLAERPPEVALTFLIQHFVVFPEHVGTGYRHTYGNDVEIRAILERSPRRVVVLSGHLHRGHLLEEHQGVTYFTGRALCERPFPYYVLHTEGEHVCVEELTAEGARAGDV